eukprot:1160617-Pelagomonas_calceolata.AAC.10
MQNCWKHRHGAGKKDAEESVKSMPAGGCKGCSSAGSTGMVQAKICRLRGKEHGGRNVARSMQSMPAAGLRALPSCSSLASAWSADSMPIGANFFAHQTSQGVAMASWITWGVT